MTIIPKVTLPVGKSGDWEIKRFKVDPHAAAMFNCTARYGRGIEPGEYTKLCHKGEVIMSDTPAERRDHIDAVLNAKGVVLINGLGLGMIANACLLDPMNKGVTKAIVIEQSSDVIKLAAPYYRKKFGKRIEIIEADALEYRPPKGSRFGMVWHDIWPTISDENLPDMIKLHRRYGRLTEWQGSWARPLCEKMREPLAYWRM